MVVRIDVCLKKFAKITASFSVGEICRNIIQVTQNYEQTVTSLKEKLYIGKNCVVKLGETNNDKITISGLEITFERELIEQVKQHESTRVKETLDRIFSGIMREKLSLSSAQMIFNDLLGIINRLTKENSIDVSIIYPTNEAPHEVLSKMETLGDIQCWMGDLYNRVIQLLSTQATLNYSVYIKKSIAFMKEHFQENISLTEVADEIGISSTYLSSEFKKEVGTGFSDYLIDLRLERAKQLIRDGNIELKEIAQLCGFNNYAYFFTVFKRKMNVTPKEYIKMM
jgi:two-component system response regulator YesN